MPIDGLVCKSCCKLVDKSGMHWAVECEAPGVHPGFVQSWVDGESHQHLKMTPTTATGKIRDVFIQRTLPYYPAAEGCNAMMCGTAVGEKAESGMRKGGWMRQVKLVGRFWDMEFVGTADLALLRDKRLLLWDNKYKSERSFLWQRGRGMLAGKEDSCQLNFYRLMDPVYDADRWPGEAGKQDYLAFLHEWREARENAELTVWYGSTLPPETNKGVAQPSWIRTRAPLMSLEDIAEVKPYDQEYTIKQQAVLLNDWFERVERGEDPKKILNEEVPRICEMAFGGKACRLYCGSNYVCLNAAGIPLRTKGIPEISGMEEKLNG